MSKLLQQLNEQRGSKIKEAQAISHKAAEEKRGFTEEERNKVKGLNDEISTLDSDIEQEVRSISAAGAQVPELSRQEQRDVNRFDISAVLRHLDRNLSGRPSKLEGIEAEMIAEGEKEARAAGVEITGIALPKMICRETRDMSVTGGTSAQYGGELVGTEKRGLASDFYKGSVLGSNGALILSDLVGNLDLPRYVAASDMTKKAENASSDELSPTVASLSLSPKRLPAHIDISDQLLKQSGETLEAYISRELTLQMLGVQEVAFFHGTGTNEPTGIAATSGIGSVAGGTNGAAPDWADIIDLEAAVGNVNAAMGNLKYITNTAVKAKLKKTLVAASTDSRMIWDSRYGLNEDESPLVTNAVRSDLDKGSSTGVCSAIFYGNVNDFVIGYWGGIMLEMVRDKSNAIAGLRTLVANTYYDGGLLRPKSFAAMLDALTA